ncbi:MAG: CoA transferase [Pseudomonadota bacterium]
MSVDLAGPYEGLRVLDFTMFVAGPYCTRLMADMGAEVIKIEPPGGEFLRAAPPVRDGHSAYFGTLNCGKKSLAIDLKQSAGLEAVKALVRTADVLIENFRPGVIERLGLGYSVLQTLKPDLVYCSVSGYGQTGPSADRPSFAPVIHAASGFDMLIPRYDPEFERPAASRYVVADALAAVHALAGIGAALYRRERTGRGEHLDVALMDTMHTLMSYEYAESQFPGLQPPIVFRPLVTRDGFLAIAPVSQGNFAALGRAAGRDDWMRDPRFATREARVANWPALVEELATWAATVDSQEAERRLTREGCPAAAFRTVGEARLDPQVAHRGSAVTVTDGSGAYAVPNCPIKFSEANASAGQHVPGVGEHGPALLAELGLPDETLAGLLRSG